MRWSIVILLVTLLSGCGQNFFVGQPRPDQLTFPPLKFTFPKVAEQQLSNGARVYMKEDHELPLVDLTLMVEGGSIYDPLDKTGLSQLFANTLATGGAGDMSPQQLESELEAMAASFNVSSSDYCYQIDLSLHRSDLQRGLQILAMVLRSPRFDQSRFTLAQERLLESIHRKNDEPSAIAHRLLNATEAPGHPFGAFPSDASVMAVTREDLLKLHERYFHPANFWFGVSGDFKQADLLADFEQLLGDWPAGDSLVRDFPSLPQPPKGEILLADKDVPQTTILMGETGISKDNSDQYALRVANFILGGGGFNSRMMREVRSNRGLAYSVYSYFQIGRHLPGMFLAGSETKSSSTAEVVKLMRQLMQGMIDKPVSEAELKLAKESLVNSFVFAFDDTHSVVTQKVRLDYYGYPQDYLENFRQNIEQVTVADVQRVSKEYLHPDQLLIVLVGDTEVFANQVKDLGLPVKKVDL